MRALSGPLALALACACVHAADAPPAAVFGAWTFDAALSRSAAGDAGASTLAGSAAPTTTGRSHAAGDRHGGGAGGMGGMAGMGGGMGTHGGGHHGGGHGDRTAGTQATPSEDEAEQRERGLARLFAAQLTITASPKQIRFDDGEHVVALGKDGMNLSGAGIGGTVVLASSAPDLVVDTLTESGYALHERYVMSADNTRLELHASLIRPGAEQAREIVRVFDRTVAAAAQPALQ